MRKIVVFLMAVTCLTMVGCSTATRPFDDYRALNKTYYTNHNEVFIGDFTYSAIRTRGMRSDQIENTAIGNIYLGTSIAELVRKGTSEELKNAGMVVKPDADLLLVGDVTEFKAADLGFTVDWTCGVTYTISQKSTEKTLFSRHYAPLMMNTRKIFLSQATLVGFMHKLIAATCEMFINDPEVRRLLDARSDG